MKRTTIEKIMRKGTAQERAILIADYSYHGRFKAPGESTDLFPLSQSEYEQLLRSFRTSEDIAAYDRFKDLHHKLELSCARISVRLNDYDRHIASFNEIVGSLVFKNESEHVIEIILNLVKGNDVLFKKVKTGTKWFLKNRGGTHIVYEEGKKSVNRSTGKSTLLNIHLEAALMIRGSIKGSIDGLKEFLFKNNIDLLQFRGITRGLESGLEYSDQCLISASKRKAAGPNKRKGELVTQVLTEKSLSGGDFTVSYTKAKKEYSDEKFIS